MSLQVATTGPTLFDSLKQYVGFNDDSSATLREYHALTQPFFGAIVDDFYRAIEEHPEASAAITGGAAQIQRLKQTLIKWLDGLFMGPHDEAYFELRARIGRKHVQIALPQVFMFTAMNRIRVRLLDVLRELLQDRPQDLQRVATAVHQIIDMELAIMLETYREDLLAKNRNAERLATIGQFAASMGHELRNPLGVMESSLFLLRQHLGRDAASAPQVAKHLDRIGAEIARANKTIHDLLDLARNRPPQRRRTPIGALVEQAATAVALPAEISLQLVAPEGLTVEGDPDQLSQVLVNLLTNAAQALGGRGEIRVEAERGASGWTRVRVRDDGPGVPEEARHRVFEALFTTKARGSGLGLALCRRIIEAHGGSIDLERPDKGASFILRLPDSQLAKGPPAA